MSDKEQLKTQKKSAKEIYEEQNKNLTKRARMN